MPLSHIAHIDTSFTTAPSASKTPPPPPLPLDPAMIPSYSAFRKITTDRVEPLIEAMHARLAIKPYLYGLEPRREFPGGLTPENADVWYAASPRSSDLAKLFAQHARNMQRQCLISLQLAAADATAASNAAYRANKEVMRAMRQPGIQFPVMRTKPLPGEPFEILVGNDPAPEGWFVGEPQEGFDHQRIMNWFDKYPSPPDIPMTKAPKCGEPSPLPLHPRDPLRPHAGQTGHHYTPEEKQEMIRQEQEKEKREQRCDHSSAAGRYECPAHGKCYCKCQEARREADAYGGDYGHDYAEGDAPLPFLPPQVRPEMLEYTLHERMVKAQSGVGHAALFCAAFSPSMVAIRKKRHDRRRIESPQAAARQALRREIVEQAAHAALVPVAVQSKIDLKDYW